MKHRIVLENSAGQTLTLTRIKAITGFGIPPVKIVSQEKGYNQDGSNVSSVTYDERPFTIIMDVSGITPTEAMQLRGNILAFFSDKEPKRLTYNRFDGFAGYLYPVHLANTVDPEERSKNRYELTLPFVASNHTSSAIPM